MNSSKSIVKKLFIFTDWFDPAYKAGGPIRSIVNCVQHLHSSYDIYIFTGARDLGESAPLPGVKLNQWINYHNLAMVYYADNDHSSLSSIRELLTDVAPDLIYLNSMFSIKFTIQPLLLKWKGKITQQIVLAPRGMLKQSALAFKKFKKGLFLQFFKLSALHRKIRFHATDEQELLDIRTHFGNVDVVLAANLPGIIMDKPYPIIKCKGTLRLLFVGRIHPIKNLLYLLELMKNIKGEIVLTIIGHLEDPAYWSRCQEVINELPVSIRVAFLGDQEHNHILNHIVRHHVLVLPTKGENFGHSIFESLSHGRPVLISDQTPWKNLQSQKAGWDIPLAAPKLFADAIQSAIAWDQSEFEYWASAALQKARLVVDLEQTKNDFQILFH